ncbi:DUF1690-domain-containing protein [Patellaria atrata CBS 101060]|uniref:DUF1690-domain-containing protein n=1 Tax=Patellaria atrata CBS 101060 TaxID=1346257 RepID=A0A9P4SBY7_9PEZI|nr:DUF1690-domain-containing protein [Patellaria atrata CBS 101060]
MGVGGSKPESERSQHVFEADTPIRFSQQLVDSLQGSPQSDSTRAKTLELQIQERVTAELERLRAEEDKRLVELYDKVSEESETSSEPSLVEKIGDKFNTSSALSEKEKQRNMSRDTVSKEITELKKKLDARKKLEQADTAVQKAKDDVVTCLRMNDRRPLDCWKEVEKFRSEVRILERDFVQKTLQ